MVSWLLQPVSARVLLASTGAEGGVLDAPALVLLLLRLLHAHHPAVEEDLLCLRAQPARLARSGSVSLRNYQLPRGQILAATCS